MLQINFFEFIFLVEACIPPVPIARAHFWEKVINEYFGKLSWEQRIHLFKSISTSSRFSHENEDCQWFYARYNPGNNYRVFTKYMGQRELHLAFLKDGRYWVGKNRYIDPDHFVKAQSIFSTPNPSDALTWKDVDWKDKMMF